MKSEHRHELQTNDLGRLAEKIGAFLEKYGNQITIVICVGALVAGGAVYWTRQKHHGEAVAWSELAFARNAEDFHDVAERRRGSSAAHWAQLEEGERRLSEGIQLLFTGERKSALLELKKSQEALQGLLAQGGIPPEIRERALFALARCQESTSDGNLDSAIQSYQELLKLYPDTVYKSFAERRIEELKTPAVKDFYAWFVKQNPNPTPKPKQPADKSQSGGDEAVKPGDSDASAATDASAKKQPAKDHPANTGRKADKSDPADKLVRDLPEDGAVAPQKPAPGRNLDEPENEGRKPPDLPGSEKDAAAPRAGDKPGGGSTPAAEPSAPGAKPAAPKSE